MSVSNEYVCDDCDANRVDSRADWLYDMHVQATRAAQCQM